MTVKRGRKAKLKETPASLLLEAVKFLKPAQAKTGTPQQQFCIACNNWVIATNEILTIGCKIQEDLNATVHTYQLEEALKKVESDLAITQVSETALAITSGDFKALVPCLPTGSFEIAPPDEACAVVSDALKPALEAAALLVNENSPETKFAAVLLQAGSCVGTNGAALVEYWHGIDLPPNLLLPRQAAQAVSKCKKTLTGFGFSETSATFWFEDESFIKTQLYKGDYANYKFVFKNADYSKLQDVPEEFFKAVEYLKPFSKLGNLYFENGFMSSDSNEGEASTYKMPFLPEGAIFSCEYLLTLKPYFKQFYFSDNEKCVYFNTDVSRGKLMACAKTENGGE